MSQSFPKGESRLVFSLLYGGQGGCAVPWFIATTERTQQQRITWRIHVCVLASVEEARRTAAALVECGELVAPLLILEAESAGEALLHLCVTERGPT
jgi:hypothetical protein